MAVLQHLLKTGLVRSSYRLAIQNHCNSFQEHRKLPISGEIMYGFYAAVTLCPYNPSPEFKDLVGRGKKYFDLTEYADMHPCPPFLLGFPLSQEQECQLNLHKIVRQGNPLIIVYQFLFLEELVNVWEKEDGVTGSELCQ